MSRAVSTRGAAARRVVVKIGSAVLAGTDGGLDRARIEALAAEIAAQHAAGREMVVVTSGAVAAAMVAAMRVRVLLMGSSCGWGPTSSSTRCG